MDQSFQIALLRAENKRLRSIISRLLRLFGILHLVYTKESKQQQAMKFDGKPIDLYNQNRGSHE